MITIFEKDNCYTLARNMNIMLTEDNIKDNVDKKILQLKSAGSKLDSTLNKVDLTSDESVEGIYYALSSFLSLSILIPRIPIFYPMKVITDFTNSHMATDVLPKYRVRLLNVYRGKIKVIDSRIEALNNNEDSDKQNEIKLRDLNTMKKALEQNCDHILVIKPGKKGDNE